MPILFSLNSNEFQALVQELKSQQVIMTSFMEEMKQQSQSNLENLRERGQPRQEVGSKPKRKFSNELEGQYFDNLRRAREFHCSPLQVEVRYLTPHKRDGGTLENVVGEIPNIAKTTATQRIFAQTNPITQPRVYEGGFSFNGGSGGHHATTCRSKWQLRTTSSSASSISSSTGSTSFSTTFCATCCSTRFRGN